MTSETEQLANDTNHSTHLWTKFMRPFLMRILNYLGNGLALLGGVIVSILLQAIFGGN